MMAGGAKSATGARDLPAGALGLVDSHGTSEEDVCLNPSESDTYADCVENGGGESYDEMLQEYQNSNYYAQVLKKGETEIPKATEEATWSLVDAATDVWGAINPWVGGAKEYVTEGSTDGLEDAVTDKGVEVVGDGVKKRYPILGGLVDSLMGGKEITDSAGDLSDTYNDVQK